MILTAQEIKICEKYSKRDEEGYVHCMECPLNLGHSLYSGFECYATIDGRTARARKLERH